MEKYNKDVDKLVKLYEDAQNGWAKQKPLPKIEPITNIPSSSSGKNYSDSGLPEDTGISQKDDLERQLKGRIIKALQSLTVDINNNAIEQKIEELIGVIIQQESIQPKGINLAQG